MGGSGRAGPRRARDGSGRDGGLHPAGGKPSLSFGSPAGAPRSPGEANPWRRAAEAIERDRARAARRAAPAAEHQPEEGGGAKRSDGHLAIARLGAPRGVEGDLRLHSFSGESSHLLGLRSVELERPSALGTPTRLRLGVSRVEEGPGGLTIAFEGYSSREAAERLVGMEILVDRSRAAPLAEGEWYIADLVGLELVSPEGNLVYGRILAVLEGGADPLLEVLLDPAYRPESEEGPEPAEAEAETKALVPFRREFIGEIDLGSGRAVLLAPWILA